MYRNGQIAPAFATANVAAGQPQPIGGLSEVVKRLSEQATRAEGLAGSLDECRSALDGAPMAATPGSIDEPPAVGALGALHTEITRISEALSRAMSFAQQVRNHVG